MNNDIDMVKAIAFRKRIKYAGDIVEQLMLAGWDLHTAILFVENLPDAEGEDDYDLSKWVDQRQGQVARRRPSGYGICLQN